MIGPLAMTTPAAWVPTLRLVPSSFRAVSISSRVVGLVSYSRFRSGLCLSDSSSVMLRTFGTRAAQLRHLALQLRDCVARLQRLLFQPLELHILIPQPGQFLGGLAQLLELRVPVGDQLLALRLRLLQLLILLPQFFQLRLVIIATGGKQRGQSDRKKRTRKGSAGFLSAKRFHAHCH